MKRIGYILMCVLSVLSVSCFDDDSNTDIRELNPIVIDLDNTDLYVNQMDTLRVEPLIYCEGVPDTQLSFEWVLMKHGTIVPQLLDTTMYFCAQITTPPDNYQLRLTVTDKTTGIYSFCESYICGWITDCRYQRRWSDQRYQLGDVSGTFCKFSYVQ